MKTISLTVTAVLLLVGSAINLAAATFTVTNTNDSGAGSLRQAIIDANANAEADTINFDPTFFGKSRTITTTGTLVVDSATDDQTTINGPGANLLTISGNDAVQIFFVWDKLAISGATLTQGRNNNGGAAIDNRGTLNVANMVFTSNFGNNGGGAIITQGVLTVANSTFDGNSTNGAGGGIAVTGTGSAAVSDSTFRNQTVPLGGGISSDGAISVNNCVFTNNAVTSGSATGLGGGAIYSNGTTATIANSTFTNNRETGNSGGGGAVRNRDGTMVISNSTFTNNTSVDGGGAIQNTGTLTINDSKIINNITTGPNAQQSGEGSGGGISSTSGQLTINNSLISGNSAENDGGGIYITATVHIANTTVSNNVANINKDLYGDGGGIWIRSDGRVTVSNSTISGNTTDRNTQTTDLRFAGHGGGFFVQGALTLDNSTVSGNFAGLDYGGIGDFNPGGTADRVDISNSTIVNNRAVGNVGGFGVDDSFDAGQNSLRNTIIANNISGGTSKDVFGPITSEGYNLIKNTTGASITGTTTGNITGVDPQLGPLQNNGGPTKTHALLKGSRAIDKGKSFGTTTDQREFTRPFDDPAISNAAGGNGADIGAYEANALKPKTLGNISTRLRVGTGDNVLIGGFIISGTQPKKVIVRAIGPSLPVAGKLANPTLELFGPNGLITSNDDWRESPNKQAIIDSTVPPSHPLESAIVATLPAKNAAYTAIVRGVGGGTGVGLVEVYDLDDTVDSTLANISSRGLVQTGDDVMIGGFIISGTTPKKVIVRAIGPSLPVTGKLADPTLELFDGNGQRIAMNDNWRQTQEAQIKATGVAPTKDREAAIVATLPPGGTTAIVRGKGGTTGVALVEIYALQ